ncbi:roadblock/LC7 domain-containing protein [Streptomyces liangshanensis]|uniref:Dynein regulation protein LC7 n=1 Tax=Streptomyces liangshanensis TaxID=2717324 RepID=A0A6G9GYA5_9ACTN|nr:roadblock/LC7 domain-containing protein [Streptomyces liangshanensis]QIQ03262.1 dynein regulation protein LC7 [Streptomyces liangshanensis]
MTDDFTTDPATAEGLGESAANFTWLLERFAAESAGVLDAIAVSSDGMLIAVSRRDGHADSERLGAVISGMLSLAAGASANYGLGDLSRVIMDYLGGRLLVSALGSGAVLGVVASKDAKLADVAYEMTLFTERAGAVISPELIVELQKRVTSAPAG